MNTIEFPALKRPQSQRPAIIGRHAPGLSLSQKALIHIYKSAACLSDADYRAILRREAHVASAGDPHFPQRGFDAVMAALETELVMRIDDGRAPQPTSRRINRLDHWRGKAAAPGATSIRQRRAIERLWEQLAESLGDAGTNDYLLGIIHKACGRRVLPHLLRGSEAGRVIDALKSRLAHAIATGPVPTAPRPCRFRPEEVPF